VDNIDKVKDNKASKWYKLSKWNSWINRLFSAFIELPFYQSVFKRRFPKIVKFVI